MVTPRTHQKPHSNPPPSRAMHVEELDERDEDHVEVSEMDEPPVINPLAQSAATVTVANPTPPTNIPYTACGTPPHVGITLSNTPSDPVQANRVATYSGDAALIAGATSGATTGQGLVLPGAAQAANTFGSLIPLSAVALTAIATPIGGSGGTPVPGPTALGNLTIIPPATTTAPPTLPVKATVAEASGAITVVTAPGSRAEAPTQWVIENPPAWSFDPNAAHASFPPAVTELIPSTTAASGGTMALTINGHGFNAGSTVTIAAVGQTVVFLSPSQLSVPAAPKRSTAGTSAVIVTTDGVAAPTATWTFV
jgi:hypothetical protein